MPNFVPVSKQTHASKRWKRFESYTFAAQEGFAELSAAELPKAATAFPIAFLEQNKSFFPIALLGFDQTKNLFVAPNGKWVGSYIPAAFRGYPFMLGKADDNRMFLCVDQDSDLITDNSEGENFYDAEGNPSEEVKKISDFLQQVDLSKQAALQACAALAKHNVIKPWPITLKTPKGETKIEGLYKIEEDALNALSDEAFLELRKSGGLFVAYCQMLSMHSIAVLSKLSEAHAKVASQTPQQGSQASIEVDDDMIKFS